ncbi:MAG: hypothetical protein KJZ95_18625 [Caldilinea sp.]|nr:hypothetical protein [Caldilinea sp.]
MGRRGHAAASGVYGGASGFRSRGSQPQVLGQCARRIVRRGHAAASGVYGGAAGFRSRGSQPQVLGP